MPQQQTHLLYVIRVASRGDRSGDRTHEVEHGGIETAPLWHCVVVSACIGHASDGALDAAPRRGDAMSADGHAGTSDAVVVGMTLPAISQFMTANPCTIDRLASLAEAHRLMKERGVRHLPVLDDGELCGIVSERDLFMVESLIGADPTSTQVDAAMTDRPFIVTSDTLLDEVVDIMTDRKYGSVVVVGHDGVEGIFTTVDACRALAQVLRDRPA